MPRDHVDERVDAAVGEPVLTCAGCGAVITRPAWAIAVAGDFERVFFNPAGRVFRVLCFRDAPGVADATPPSGEFTWFPGYSWRIAICRGCGDHLGWRYEALREAAGAGPAVFFGLIKDKLSTGRGAGTGPTAAPDAP